MTSIIGGFNFGFSFTLFVLFTHCTVGVIAFVFITPFVYVPQHTIMSVVFYKVNS